MTERARVTDARIEACVRALVAKRAPASICPSEVARALLPDAFRALMPRVREAAQRLAHRGEVVVTQRGRAVDVVTAHGPIRIAAAIVDFRARPELYRIVRGEEGVLTVEPYKSELLPLWRFRTPELARRSVAALWKAFLRYRRARDFVGMDMTRKFLEMGFTRARRYARHRSGRKYDAGGAELPEALDAEKAESAAIFRAAWERAEAEPTYRAFRAQARNAPDAARPSPIV